MMQCNLPFSDSTGYQDLGYNSARFAFLSAPMTDRIWLCMVGTNRIFFCRITESRNEICGCRGYSYKKNLGLPNLALLKGFLVSKEPVVLHWWEGETKIGFYQPIYLFIFFLYVNLYISNKWYNNISNNNNKNKNNENITTLQLIALETLPRP